MGELKSVSGSRAEDLFIDIFTDTFGADKAGFLYSQYPFFDIYQNARFADFLSFGMPKCLLHDIFYVYCPLCGGTRRSRSASALRLPAPRPEKGAPPPAREPEAALLSDGVVIRLIRRRFPQRLQPGRLPLRQALPACRR